MNDNQNQNDSTSGRKPNVSEVEVLSTSTALIKANGATTTLEVKKKLREDGYWAKQAEVSEIMWKLYGEGKLQSTNDMSRQYQIYTMPEPETKTFVQHLQSFFGFGK